MFRLLRLTLAVAAVLALQTSAAAQGIVIPNTFANGTSADANQVNANFAALANTALNRSGGTMTGNLLFSSDNTLDIGASGATRPRDYFGGRHLAIGGNATIGGTLTTTGAATIGGALAVTSAGPNSFGAAPAANVQLYLAGTFTPSGGYDIGINYAGTINAEANASVHGVQFNPTLVEASSGTHPIFSTLTAIAPTVTAGAASVTTATTMYVTGVPANATTNYAVLVDAAGDDGPHVALSDSTDVAHGITSSIPTAVYGTLRKASATAGGLSVAGYSEDTAGVQFIGNATNVVTTETGGSAGNIQLIAVVKSGAGVTSHAADDNIVVFRNSNSTTHIFKGNGDSYQDGAGWTAYDTHDDLGLVQTLERELTGRRDLIGDLAALGYDRAELERQRLVSFDEDGRPFINVARISMVLSGAIRQEAAKRRDTEARVARLDSSLQDLRAANALLVAELQALRAALEHDQPVRVQ